MVNTREITNSPGNLSSVHQDRKIDASGRDKIWAALVATGSTTAQPNNVSSTGGPETLQDFTVDI
jgi:hypothetical protein